MNPVFKMDEYDRKLLYELDKDSSASLSHLAKSISKSKQFTLYRLHRLEDEGIITHYNAIVDMAKLGFFTFRIYLKLKQTTSEDVNEIVEYLKSLKNIWTIAVCHGKWDLAFFIGANRIEDVHEVWDKFLSEYKRNVDTYNFSMYSPVFNFNRTFFLEKKEEARRQDVITRVYGRTGNEETDEIDWRIIKIYAPDVRQSILQLSRKLGASPETVKKRIKRMEDKKIICGYKIGLNIYKLGYASYRIDLDLLSTARNREIFEYCRQHKNIYQINKTVGHSDFEIELVVKDLNQLLNIIDEIKTRFKDVINNASYFSYSTYFLLNYIPD